MIRRTARDLAQTLAAGRLYAFGGVDVQQEQASGLAGELLSGHSFGQTFTPQYDGLYHVDLYTATYARDNTHPVSSASRGTGGADGSRAPRAACGDDQ